MTRFAFAAALFAVVVTSPAVADPRQDLIDDMAKCATVHDGTARLACYDALNPAVMAAQNQTPAAPAAGAPPTVAANPPTFDPYRPLGVPSSEQIKPDQFGGENLAPPAPPPGREAQAPAAPEPQTLDSITIGVTDYSYNPYDKFLVILDNGQIWRQSESDTSAKAHFSKGEKNSVTISRGFLGSYNLVINDGGTVYKVKRLK